MELILDIIEGSSVSIGVEQSTATRSALVTNIPAQAKSDPYVLCRAIRESGGPQLGSTYEGLPNLRLTKIVASPTAGTNEAIVRYMYEGLTPNGSGTSAVAILVVEDDSTLATEQTEVDTNGKVIQAFYDFDVATTDAGYATIKQVPGPPRGGSVPILRPRRVLNVSGLIYGREAPSAWTRTALGTVNFDPFPSGSLWTEDKPDPPGYWLCTHVSCSVDRYTAKVFEPKTRPYRVRASFMSNVSRDWASYVFWRNFYGHIPTDMGKRAADILALRAKAYSPGQDISVKGITKVCPYLRSDFTKIFGI